MIGSLENHSNTVYTSLIIYKNNKSGTVQNYSTFRFKLTKCTSSKTVKSISVS